MKTHNWLTALVCAGVFASGVAYADVWDGGAFGSGGDNGTFTANRLTHGTEQVHDMPVNFGNVADQDWYIVVVPPYASYEIVVDGMTGNLPVLGQLDIKRLASDGSTILQTAVYVDNAGIAAQRLAWINATANAETSFIRVQGALCGIGCTTNDQYTIRARETTVFIARFNNAGSQVTVLLSQNASNASATARYFYWSPTGTLLHTGVLSNLPKKNLNVLSTTSILALAGVSGHITIAHDAAYGTYNVKAVSLEPSTGFSFDTPGVVRP